MSGLIILVHMVGVILTNIITPKKTPFFYHVDFKKKKNKGSLYGIPTHFWSFTVDILTDI